MSKFGVNFMICELQSIIIIDRSRQAAFNADNWPGPYYLTIFPLQLFSIMAMRPTEINHYSKCRVTYVISFAGCESREEKNRVSRVSERLAAF